jgi:hypothetical protein
MISPSFFFLDERFFLKEEQLYYLTKVDQKHKLVITKDKVKSIMKKVDISALIRPLQKLLKDITGLGSLKT